MTSWFVCYKNDGTVAPVRNGDDRIRYIKESKEKHEKYRNAIEAHLKAKGLEEEARFGIVTVLAMLLVSSDNDAVREAILELDFVEKVEAVNMDNKLTIARRTA